MYSTKVQAQYFIANEITSNNLPVLMHYDLAFLMKLRSGLSTNQSICILHWAGT
jgi:hypothetical protein